MRHILATAAILLSACATTTQPPVATIPSCPHPWAGELAHAAAQGWQFTELPPAQREAFIRAYDSVPPPTHTEADAIYVGRVPQDSEHRVVVIVKDSCIVDAEVATPELLNAMVDDSGI